MVLSSSSSSSSAIGMAATMGVRTSPMVMARNMTAARAPRYAMYFIAAALILLIVALAANPSGLSVSFDRTSRYQVRADTDGNGSGRDRKLQSDSSSWSSQRDANINNHGNGAGVTPMSATEGLLTREFEAMGHHARSCERLGVAISRLRRRNRVRESLAPLDSSRDTSNARQSVEERETYRIIDERYRASEHACSNLRVQVQSLMALMTSYRNSNKQDMSTLREILNRVESLKTWREEQFEGLVMSLDTKSSQTNSEHDHMVHHTTLLDDDEKDRRVETGDSTLDGTLPSIDSEHWLDDAPDPDFRLPPVPEPTPEEVAVARDAAAKFAVVEARALAAQTEEAKKAAALADTIAQRAAGTIVVNLTIEEEARWKECERLVVSFSIIPKVQWGTATPAVQSEYKRRKCDDLLTLRPVFVPVAVAATAPAAPPLAEHQMKLWSDCAWIHGGYDMMLGTSWGFAGRDLQRMWKTMGCDAVMKSKAVPPWTDPFWQTHGVEAVKVRPRADEEPQSLPVVAILVPTTTRGLNDIRSMKHLSLFSALLPSIRRTAEGGFDYHIWIGYDQDDAYFTSEGAAAEITGWCNAQMTWLSNHARGIKIFVRLVSLTNNTYRKPGHAVNELAMMAYNDPATSYSYFYRVSDDVQMIDRWMKPFSDAIISFGAPLYGVVGPRCDESTDNSTTILQDFVHRSHLTIFGPYYYPYILSDWWNDNWISRIYGRTRTIRFMNIRVRHRFHSHGTRYQIDLRHEAFVEPEVTAARQRILTFLHDVTNNGAPHGDAVIKAYTNDVFNFTVSAG